jgi:uncharacterized coiled-coil DUF342 family protein
MVMDQYEQVDWGALVTVLLKCMDEQKLVLQELTEKIDKLSETSKKDEIVINSDTDELIENLTNRVGHMETEGCDTLKELMSFVDQHHVEMAAVRSDVDRLNGTAAMVQCDIDRLKTMMPEANKKLNDVQVKHNRLERHAVDHWGYRF